MALSPLAGLDPRTTARLAGPVTAAANLLGDGTTEDLAIEVRKILDAPDERGLLILSQPEDRQGLADRCGEFEHLARIKTGDDVLREVRAADSHVPGVVAYVGAAHDPLVLLVEVILHAAGIIQDAVAPVVGQHGPGPPPSAPDRWAGR